MRARPTHERYARLPWLIIGMTVLVVATVAAGLHYVEGRLVAATGESLAFAAAEIADKLDLLLIEQYDHTLELSRTGVFLARDGDAQSAHLATVKATHPIYLWLGVTDAAGRIVAATDPASIGKDRSRSAWFVAARGADGAHMSRVGPFEETGGTDAVSFTAPVRGARGEFLGTVTTCVGLPALEEVLTRMIQAFRTREEFAGSIEYQFMDAGGRAFIDSDLLHKGNVNLKQLDLPSARMSESGKPGYVEELHKRRHVPVITGYAQTRGFAGIPDSRWTILVRMGRADVLAPIRKVLWTLGTASLLIGAPLFLLLVWSTARLKKEWALAEEEHARAATAESEYRLLVDQARDIIYRTDAQGRFTFVNPVATRLMGYAPQELIGRRFVELVRPDARENAERFYGRQFLRKTPSTYYEFPAVVKDGADIWFGQNVQTLIQGGRVIGFHAVARDITERKRAEEQLQKNQMVLEQAQRVAKLGVWHWDILTGTVTWSSQLYRLFGLEPEKFCPTYEGFLDLIHPDDRNDVQGAINSAYRSGRPYEVEFKVLRPDGTVWWNHSCGELIRDAGGTPVAMVGIAQDITERKRAELRLQERSRQQAIEAQLSLLAATEQDLSSLLATAVKLTSNALEVNYCEALELLPNGSELRLRASAGWKGDRIGQARALEPSSLAHAALQSNKPVVRTLPDDIRSGGPPWLHTHGAVGGMSVIIPGQDRPWGVLGVYTTGARAFSRDDINFLQTVSSILATAIERAQAETVLRNANEALRLLSRQLLQVQESERRAIARDLHDEIGQSLTAIKLNVERAQRTSEPAARARIMQDCIQIAERVLGQVRNLSLDLHPSILDDLGLTFALKWYAGRLTEQAGLKVEVTADPSLPRLSQEVEIACFRIAQEALTNVVRHARAGRADITLKRGAAAVELSVQDDGVGFAADKAFPASTGLASMQERAKLLGGTVTIASARRRGTKVIATLPLLVAAPADAPTQEARRS